MAIPKTANLSRQRAVVLAALRQGVRPKPPHAPLELPTRLEDVRVMLERSKEAKRSI